MPDIKTILQILDSLVRVVAFLKDIPLATDAISKTFNIDIMWAFKDYRLILGCIVAITYMSSKSVSASAGILVVCMSIYAKSGSGTHLKIREEVERTLLFVERKVVVPLLRSAGIEKVVPIPEREIATERTAKDTLPSMRQVNTTKRTRKVADVDDTLH